MQIKFDKSFLKSLDKLNLAELKPKIESIIADVENAETLSQIRQI